MISTSIILPPTSPSGQRVKRGFMPASLGHVPSAPGVANRSAGGAQPTEGSGDPCGTGERQGGAEGGSRVAHRQQHRATRQGGDAPAGRAAPVSRGTQAFDRAGRHRPFHGTPRALDAGRSASRRDRRSPSGARCPRRQRSAPARPGDGLTFQEGNHKPELGSRETDASIRHALGASTWLFAGYLLPI